VQTRQNQHHTANSSDRRKRYMSQKLFP